MMRSEVLNRDLRYTVYLPPDYATSTRSYPVIYLLHGGGAGEDADYVRYGDLNQVLDEAIARGAMPPVIVVTPDGRRDEANRNNTYYMNDLDGAVRWQDMFFEDFIPFVESTYRVIPDKDHRAIAGISMGGYGALAYSLMQPDMFAGAVALSAAFRTDEQIVAMDQAGYDRRYGKAWGMGLQGEARLNDAYRRYSVLDLVDKVPVESMTETGYYIDCGAADDFFDGNAVLHQKLRDHKVPHRFMIREGGHVWEYWRSGLGEGFLFLGDLFRQVEDPYRVSR